MTPPSTHEGFRPVWVDGLPLFAGYLPASMAFGMAARHMGFSPWGTMAMSALIYAGTSQFAMASLWAGHAPAWLDIVTVWLINMRHMGYGPALTARQRLSDPNLPIMTGWGLTDEVFAVSVRNPHSTLLYHGGVTLVAYSAWILGTAAGAAFGGVILHTLPSAGSALTFVLPALFIAILWHWIQPEPGRWDRRVLAVLALTAGLYAVARLSGLGTMAVPLAAAGAAGAETVGARVARRRRRAP